jgi:hypothetical protein
MPAIQKQLPNNKGICAGMDPRESDNNTWIVIDVESKKPPGKSIFLIRWVTDSMLALDYCDIQEMHYVPLDKIIKVNVVLREA